MTRGEFDRAAARLVALWPRHFAESTLAVYHEAVTPYSGEELEEVVKALVRETEYAPPVKLLLEKLRANRLRDQLRLAPPRPTPAAESEYVSLLLRLVREFKAGRVPRVDFDKLTRPESWRFDRTTGRAAPDLVLELRQYLEVFETPAEALT